MASPSCSNCETSTTDENDCINCFDCKNKFCSTCSGMPLDLYKSLKLLTGCSWKCKTCVAKKDELKSLLETMQSKIETMQSKNETMQSKIQSEIRLGHEENKKEREKIMEGLKSLESVSRRVDTVEEKQAEIKENMEKDRQERKSEITEINKEFGRFTTVSAQVSKIQESVTSQDERISKIENRTEEHHPGKPDIRQTNAIIREIREIESRGKNLILNNIPESTNENAEERKSEDVTKTLSVLTELGITDIAPSMPFAWALNLTTTANFWLSQTLRQMSRGS